MGDTDVVRRFNQRIPMRDGVTLSADLALPASRPAPAVVIRTPYGKTGEAYSRRGEVYGKGGYALVIVDVRGRGDSDDVFEPYRNDGPDGADVIAWVAEQAWCTGDVATYGGSYGGKIQWLTALREPPALRAMVALVTPSDPFVEWPTGTPGPMSINWHRKVDGRAPQYDENVDWMAVYRHRPLMTMDEAAGFAAPAWREQLRHTTLDDWWEPHRYQHRIADVDVPVLHISGWYDDEEIGTPANFAAMTAAGRAGQRLLMGPWGHMVNTTRVLGDVDFGPAALIDLDGYVLAFLDEHVKGVRPAAAAAQVRYFVMGANEWRDAGEWPPAGATQTVFRLSSGGQANSRYGDGRLVPAGVPAPDAAGGAEPDAASGAEDEPPDEWVHDPDHPVPFPTGAGSTQIGGPDDCLGLEGRGDVLVYTSGPLTEALEVIGPVTVVAHVATDARDTDITAKLVDVHPGGFAQRLCDGMVRLRYRDGCAAAEPVVSGEVYEVTISLWDTSVRLDPGHRVRLEIASSAFPKYDVNLGTGGDMVTETDGVVATNRIWHTSGRPSRLILG